MSNKQQIWFIEELGYIFSTVTLKMSITILLLRLCGPRRYRILVLGTGFLYLVAGIGFTLVIVFQCTPSTFYWDKSIDGYCIPEHDLIPLAYINAALTASTDFVFALLPIRIIWNMQMDKGTKISVGIVLGLGLLFVPLHFNLARFNTNYHQGPVL